MMRMRSAVATLAALALSTTLAGSAIAADETEPEPEPIGVFSIESMTWLLTGQAVDGEIVPVPDGVVVVSLLMENGRAGGSGGCNNYFASYEIDGFDVTFDEIGATLMACVGPAGDVETAYFANLGLVASYQSGGIQMALLDADGDFILEFDLAPEATVVGSWVAQGINNQVGGVVSSESTSAVTAEYGAAGELSGNDGCNSYSTSYVVDGDDITIAPEIVTTRMACASDELTEQSQWYYGALAATTTWAVDVNGALELRDDGGALQVRYEPVTS
jgi:heat shock protein HslJ